MNLNIGILIISITLLGYFSNLLNGKFLNSFFIRWLYYIGAIIHEFSHAILCVLTGAKITHMSIFSRTPHVTHTKSKIPILGQALISLAPIAGGILFIILINHLLLNDFVEFQTINIIYEIPNYILSVIKSLNFLLWQTYVFIILILNTGAMIGPSFQDLKNIWPILIISFFIKSQLLSSILLGVIAILALNILLQIFMIIISFAFRKQR